MGKYFGTDGIRGVANVELTPELALQAGKSIARFTRIENGGRPSILIGRDTRISGEMIEGALVSGITSQGCDVMLAGVIPTPAAAYLVKALQLDCAIIISASHNPMQDNGIKCFSRQGYKLSEKEEQIIENFIDAKDNDARCTGGDLGRVVQIADAGRRYENYLVKLADVRLDGISVAMDCANGSTYLAAPNVLSSLGAGVAAFSCNPNGTNINLGCGSTNPMLLQNLVKSGDFHLGLAFDGDGDRLIAVDERGDLADGDQLMSIFGRFYAEKGLLDGKCLVATVMSNLGLDLSLKEAGIKLVRTDVGDRYVLETMLKEGAVLGGEQSGHIIFLKENTTGDGIISAIHLLRIMKETGLTLSKLKEWMRKYPQVMKNVPVTDKEKMAKNVSLKSYIRKREAGGNFRIVVRPSGTEPVIRVMAEGPDENSTRDLVEDVCNVIEKIHSKDGSEGLQTFKIK
jgi:phosphoglucosamine mutase